MARQIELFLTPDDTLALEQRVFPKDQVFLARDESPTTQLRKADHLLEAEDGRLVLHYYAIPVALVERVQTQRITQRGAWSIHELGISRHGDIMRFDER